MNMMSSAQNTRHCHGSPRNQSFKQLHYYTEEQEQNSCRQCLLTIGQIKLNNSG